MARKLTPKMERLLASVAAKEGGWYEGLPFQASTFRALAARGLVDVAPCCTDVCGRLVNRGALKARMKASAPMEGSA